MDMVLNHLWYYLVLGIPTKVTHICKHQVCCEGQGYIVRPSGTKSNGAQPRRRVMEAYKQAHDVKQGGILHGIQADASP